MRSPNDRRRDERERYPGLSHTASCMSLSLMRATQADESVDRHALQEFHQNTRRFVRKLIDEEMRARQRATGHHLASFAPLRLIR
jgi:hypothetical protein